MTMDKNEVLQEWVAGGGSHHGPNVETVTMPLADYVRFRAALREQPEAVLATLAALDHDALDAANQRAAWTDQDAARAANEQSFKARKALRALTAAQQPGQEGGGDVTCPYRTTCTCLGACAFGLSGNGATAHPHVPEGYTLIATNTLKQLIGPENMALIEAACRFPR